MCATPKTRTSPLNMQCPWDGEPVLSDWEVQVRGMTLGFCSRRCMERFQRTSQVFLKPWRLV